VDAPLRRCERINIPESRGSSGQPKKRLNKMISQDLKILGLTNDIAQDRRMWQEWIKVLKYREIAS